MFSAATSTSVSSSSGSKSINIKSTANGNNIGYEVVSYDTPITAVTTAATSVTIKYSSNSSTSRRVGSVILKQSESEKIITTTVTQSGKTPSFIWASGVVLSSAKDSTGYTEIDVTDRGTVISKPSWASVTCSNGKITVTALSANTNANGVGRKDTSDIRIGDSTISFTIFQMPASYNSVDGYEYATILNLKWAIKNVGASSVTDIGNYYQWGKGSRTFQQTSAETIYDGTESILASSADTATQVMGGGWRMPTHDEMKKSIAFNSNGAWLALYNGVRGMVVYEGINATGGTGNKNMIFIPLTGYLDSEGRFIDGNFTLIINTSTRYTTFASYGYYMIKGWSNEVYSVYFGNGIPIRGVHD